MSDKKFVNDYLKDFSSLLQPNENIVNKIISVRDVLIGAKQNKKKIMIFGNGGSAAIANIVLDAVLFQSLGLTGIVIASTTVWSALALFYFSQLPQWTLRRNAGVRWSLTLSLSVASIALPAIALTSGIPGLPTSCLLCLFVIIFFIERPNSNDSA